MLRLKWPEPKEGSNLSKTFLIVDDSETFRKSVSKSLRNFGIEVLEAEDGEKGWQVALESAGTINAIISDYNMPNLNGLDFLKKVKKSDITKHIPFMMLSSVGKQGDMRKEARRLGAIGWLSKPLSDVQIKHIVEKV